MCVKYYLFIIFYCLCCTFIFLNIIVTNYHFTTFVKVVRRQVIQKNNLNIRSDRYVITYKLEVIIRTLIEIRN